MDLTYRDIGATLTDRWPAGYRHVRRQAEVGPGTAAFDQLAAGMRAWGIHLGAGLRMRMAGPPAVDTEFRCGIGLGPVRLWAPCRVVWLIDEAGRYGYGFGTLPGHPESGEEAFLVTADSAGRVRFEVRVFSRHAAWYTRLGGPVTRWAQDAVTDRYVTAARRLADQPG